MSLNKSLSALLFVLILASAAFAQGGGTAQTTGGIKGKVRIESGGAAPGVTVTARQGESEVASATTNSKGEFMIERLAPGVYGLTFRKTGLSVGKLENIEVRAGKVKSLTDRLILTVDEGAIVFLRGSVFTPDGRSVSGARVEVARVEAGGTAKKLDTSRVTNETGQFVFRLPPDKATYRVTVKISGAEPATKDVEVDGPAVYRVAISLQPAAK